MDLDIEDGIDLIAKAVEKYEEDRAFSMWLTLYPDMSRDNFMPFSEFYEMSTNRSTLVEPTKRSTQEILNEMAEIRKQFELPSPEADLTQ